MKHVVNKSQVNALVAATFLGNLQSVKCMMNRNLQAVLGLMAFVLSFGLPSLNAQIVINEFSAANYSDWDVGDNHDWVELYNAGAASFDISGFHLSDNELNPTKWAFPAGTVIDPGEYVVVLLSGLGELEPMAFGYMNANFRIKQTANEEMVFANASGDIVEMYAWSDIGPTQTNQSWGRSPDGADNWRVHDNPSPEGANGGPTASGFSPTPVFDQQAGYYGGTLDVTITAPEAGASIYYTLDSSTPDDGSTLYTGPITVSNTTVIRAIAYSGDADIFPSLVETNTYFLGADTHTIPVVSVAGDEIADGAWPWAGGEQEIASIEFFNADGEFIDDCVGDTNEHGNDSNAYDQRGFDYVSRDQYGYDHAIHHNPFAQFTDRENYQRFIFKAAANDNYSFEDGGAHVRDLYVHTLSELGGLKLDERRGSYCIVYLNGEYWGVYDIREKADDLDYTDYYYDQERGFVDFLKTWGGTWEEYGNGDDWYDLVDFITTNDMTDAANYEYVEANLNTKSLIDYFIMNSYIVSQDWLNWNTAWWRGRHPDGDAKRWRYVLWDCDASFGHYVNYTGIPDTGPTADPCNPESMGDVGGQGHIPVLNALMDNETFFSEYVARYAAQSNTIYSCATMNAVLDSMTAVIAPEMERQTSTWGGTVAGWEENVQAMRDFIDERCSDEFVSGMEDCYDVEAVTITLIINGEGQVEIEGSIVSQWETPWDGTFYTDIFIDLEAVPLGTEFLGWEIVAGDITFADLLDPDQQITLTGDVTIIANFSTNIDPQEILYDVDPPLSGDILLDGATTAPHPNTILTDAGTHVITALPNEWFVFDHWELENATFTPGTSDSTGTFTVLTTDTVVAFFNEIPHFPITLDVMPEGAGTIALAGLDYPDLPWTGDVIAGVDLTLVTTPADSWSVFSHWELNNHVVLPDEFTPAVILNLDQSDVIVAVYEVTPHAEITVQVDPPLAGLVTLENGPSIDFTWTGELEGEVVQPFFASANPYWRFTGWEALNHDPSPNSTDQAVGFTFFESDTVVAHFEQVPFQVFVPNSFSPDNDGINEFWQPVVSAIADGTYEVMVFGRNGEMIFHSTDPNEVWDGSHQDRDHFVQNEVYAYRLSVKPIHDSEIKTFSGHVTIMR